MPRILDLHNGFTVDLDAVEAICRRFHVSRLDLFGSATGPEFDPDRSDVDLLVEFDHSNGHTVGFDDYLALRDALQAFFGRPVDLLSKPVADIRNPFLRRAIDSQRRALFAVPAAA